jgi:diguanylate cyclase (GGDEF)-like protein
MSEGPAPLLGTIRARMLFTFGLTMGVLVLGASISVLVMGRVQSVVNDFIVQEFPRSQRIRDLNHLVEGVAISSQRVSHAQTKAELEDSYEQIDTLLLKLDATVDEVSRRGVDSETLQIIRRLQVVRSEAQLGFQLRGVALDLASRLEQIQAQGRDRCAGLADLALSDGSDPGAERSPLTNSQRRAVWRSTRTIASLLSGRSGPEAAERRAQGQVLAAIAALRRVHEALSVGHKDLRDDLDHLIGVDWPQFFARRRRQAELTQTSDSVLHDLQQTVTGAVAILEGYTRELLTRFDRRRARVLVIERSAVLLIVVVSLLGAAAITLVLRQLVLHGFSRRLDVISQALARLPSTQEDTRVAVAGNDEIATMARRLEVLLQKALHIQVVMTTDELTQINNRRSFFQLTATQRKQASRSVRTDSLLMLDIDFFKRINDTHGHDVGDVVLKTVAQTCLGCLREYDILARMGGEEFSIYCPDTNQDAAAKLAERICDTIRRLDLGAVEGSVTLSVGVVQIPPGAGTMASWLKLADQALYSAKAQGRDRVVVANPGDQ